MSLYSWLVLFSVLWAGRIWVLTSPQKWKVSCHNVLMCPLHLYMWGVSTNLVRVVHSEDVSFKFLGVRARITLLHHCVERFPWYSSIRMHFEEVLIAALGKQKLWHYLPNKWVKLTSTCAFVIAVFFAINSRSSLVSILLAWAHPILIPNTFKITTIEIDQSSP